MIGASILTADFMDSQAPFKLDESTLLKQILATTRIYDFLFQLAWILPRWSLGSVWKRSPLPSLTPRSNRRWIGRGGRLTSLLQGLLHVVRPHHRPHHLEMAAVVEQEIQAPSDLAEQKVQDDKTVEAWLLPLFIKLLLAACCSHD